jgi:hypothetical protein
MTRVLTFDHHFFVTSLKDYYDFNFGILLGFFFKIDFFFNFILQH